jgi:hypothetical protein
VPEGLRQRLGRQSPEKALQFVPPGLDQLVFLKFPVDLIGISAVIHQALQFIDGDLPHEPEFLTEELNRFGGKRHGSCSSTHPSGQGSVCGGSLTSCSQCLQQSYSLTTAPFRSPCET